MSAQPQPISTFPPVPAHVAGSQPPARADQEQLHVLAFDAIRHILTDPNTPASVRLKAALAVLNGQIPAPLTPAPPPEPTLAIAPAKPQPPATPTEIARNAPCPCGSGEKYKRCCGTQAPPKLGAPRIAAPGAAPPLAA
jgi:hypothetical protein